MRWKIVKSRARSSPVVARRARTGPSRDRRWARLLGVILLVLPVAWGAFALTSAQPRPARPLALGFTFSQRQAEYLALPWDEVFDAVLDLSPTIIRLGAYWDEIEPYEGVYDWSTLDAQLDGAEERGLDVVLTVGMKAPRWPEYFLPAWLEPRLELDDRATVSAHPELRRRTLAFVERLVRRYRGHDAITHWQIENEPLDPAGPHHWRIGPGFLAQEVALVRELDDRPVIVTMFVEVNPILLAPWRQQETRSRAAMILNLADILGLDLYPSRSYRAHGGDWYFRWPAWLWKPTVVELQRLAQRMERRAWIMEAQAEPWEPDRIVYTDAPLSRSVRPGSAAAAIRQLREVGFDTILLWGVEHWYMRRARHQDMVWWNQMRLFFPLAATPSSTPVSLGDEGAARWNAS
jgi:hypothetical protein